MFDEHGEEFWSRSRDIGQAASACLGNCRKKFLCRRHAEHPAGEFCRGVPAVPGDQRLDRGDFSEFFVWPGDFLRGFFWRRRAPAGFFRSFLNRRRSSFRASIRFCLAHRADSLHPSQHIIREVRRQHNGTRSRVGAATAAASDPQLNLQARERPNWRALVRPVRLQHIAKLRLEGGRGFDVGSATLLKFSAGTGMRCAITLGSSPRVWYG